MTDLFLAPAVNPVARANFEQTVGSRVALNRLEGMSRAAIAAARKVRQGTAAWGTKPGKENINLSTWQAIEPGDWVLFYFDRRFVVAGRVLIRERSREVATRLWGVDEDGETWEHLYLMDELRHLDVPRRVVTDAFGYKSNFYPRGFTRVRRDLVARPESVERTLADLVATGDALDRSIEAFRDGDVASRVVAADRLGDLLPDPGVREEAIRSRIASDPPRERSALRKEIERDRRLAVAIKALYEGKCQCCGFTFLKPDGTPYSEAAHLREISLREANLNVKDNLLALCPNHHKMLDYRAMEIEYDADADVLLWRRGGSVTPIENRHIGPGRPKPRRGRRTRLP